MASFNPSGTSYVPFPSGRTFASHMSRNHPSESYHMRCLHNHEAAKSHSDTLYPDLQRLTPFCSRGLVTVLLSHTHVPVHARQETRCSIRYAKICRKLLLACPQKMFLTQKQTPLGLTVYGVDKARFDLHKIVQGHRYVTIGATTV